MGFTNCYDDTTRAEAYASPEFAKTYYLAFRDLPTIFSEHISGKRALDFGERPPTSLQARVTHRRRYRGLRQPVTVALLSPVTPLPHSSTERRSALPRRAIGGATGAVVLGLTNGLAYTFSVHATNAIGNGPESAQSPAVTPVAITSPDMSTTMTGPASVIAGGNAAYSVVVTNLGTTTASAVTVSDSASGATVSSVATTQGACTTVGTSITCNLGGVGAGNSVTITVTLKPTAQTTNQASLQSAGDPNAANNTASVATAFIPQNQTTDVQLVGSAQNGGPAVTGTDTFTWQIRNNQSLAATAVHFASTLAPEMVLQTVSSNVGICSSPGPSTAGATFTCDLATLSGGQTMIVTVNVTFNATGTMSTIGQVTFNGTDNNPANNSSSITIGVK